MNLSDSSETVKKYLIAFAVFAIVVILLQFSFSIFSGFSFGGGGSGGTGFRPPPEPGDIQELPALTSINILNPDEVTYATDNVFRELTIQEIEVYGVGEPRVRFQTDEIARDIARRLGFESAPIETDTELNWQESQKRLQYNRLNNSWDYTNDAVLTAQIETIFSGRPSSYISQARSLANNIGVERERLDFETLEVDYLRLLNGELINANSPGTTEFIKLRVYRKFDPVPGGSGEDLHIRSVTDDYFSAPLEIIIRADNPRTLNSNLIYSLNFTGWEFTESVSYPIIGATRAWENVKQEQGGIKEFTEIGLNRYQQRNIRSREILNLTARYQQVELAYLEPDDWSGFIYPIYIFRGRARTVDSPAQDNADFVIYSYAIDLEQPTPPE